jgi:hypothetical protein
MIYLILVLSLLQSVSAKQEIAAPYVDFDSSKVNFELKAEEYKNISNPKYKDYFIVLNHHQSIDAIDSFGKTLASLKHDFDWVKRVKPLKSCNFLLVETHFLKTLKEINLKNETVWQAKLDGQIHHDVDVTADDTYLLLYKKPLSKDIKLENGCKTEEVITDYVVEIDRSGKEIFKWSFVDHFLKILNQDKCTNERRERMASSHYAHNLLDWVHPNSVQALGENKWHKKGYKEFNPENILVTSHHLNRAFIIDKASKRIVWVYKGDEIGLDGPHEAEMIPKGFPGAGNILIYDNGQHRGYSRILEINPITKKIVWQYKKPGEFFSEFAGSQKRLKNGDTFISDDDSARVFIINKKGQIQWQYTLLNEKWMRRSSIYKKSDFPGCFEGN